MTWISVVLPVLNEQENLEAIAARLRSVLASLESTDYEIIFVDDGSSDNSPRILAALHRTDPRIRVVRLSRNFGHQAALQAGLDTCLGDAVVLMDADLQDPPELITELIKQWKAGYEVVYAVRKKRKEALLKRACYAVFYRSMKLMANIDVPLDAGDFCLLDRRAIQVLTSLRERNRFLRGLRSWIGFAQIGVEYERQPRYAGEPKYSLRKLIGLALSGYIGFSAMPLRIASGVGICSAAGGLLLVLWAVLYRLSGRATPWGWASTISVVLFIGGVQLVMLGVIGEYLGRTYDEVRSRPLYIISHRLETQDADRSLTTSFAAPADERGNLSLTDRSSRIRSRLG